MKKVFRFVLALIPLALGIGAMYMLVKTKPKAKKKPVDHRGTLVETIKVASTSQTIDVHANGTVSAEHLQVVSPEVGGRIIWLNDDIEIGAHFKAKERVARVDGRDYYLAIQAQKAAVDSARTALEIEQNLAKSARNDWKVMGLKKPPKGSIALREPQMRTARMNIKAARSGLLRSQLTASKTLVLAPFNGIVVDKKVSKRQLVLPGAPLITLASTDRFLVTVSVPLRRLEWVRVPGVNGIDADGGSRVEVQQRVGDKFVVRMGKVIRMNAQLDPRGRMAQLIIAIDDPLRLKKGAEYKLNTKIAPAQLSKLPLLIGSFVKVRIFGKKVDNLVEVPRLALRNGDQVYVMTKDNKLDIRTLSILWRLEQSVLVNKGLSDGDQVIVSPVPVPLKGMKLRRAEQSASKTKKPPAAKLPASGAKTTKNESASTSKTSATVGKP